MYIGINISYINIRETMYTGISYVYNRNNRRRNDKGLHVWHHNDKTDLSKYLLGTNHNSRKKQNMEGWLMQC